MKGRYKGKLSCFLVVLLLLSFLCGCGNKYGNIYVLEAPYESRQLVENWLAYKTQVEDTTKFADQTTGGKKDESKVPKEQADTGNEVATEEKEEEKKEPFVQPETHTEVKDAVVQPLQEHGFYYQYLSDSLKVVYDEILKSMLQMEKVKISTLSEEQADLAFRCVLYDHPEIFYVTGYQIVKKTMDGSTIELSFCGEFTLSKEEVLERQKQIDAYVANFHKSLWNGMDEYEKMKAVYDYVVTNTTYNMNSSDNQNVCSVFLNGESVCQGYAEATQYLLQTLGMESSIVSGVVNDGNRHAWNIVKVNGSYYYVDTTWGDADYRIVDESGEVAKSDMAQINYDYFLVTTSQLELTHQIEALITMPVCNATADNYYVREQLLFESVDEAQIAEAFQRAYASGQGTVTLKAANASVYAELRNYMLDEQKVFQYMQSSGPVSFSEDEQMGTLCFWL